MQYSCYSIIGCRTVETNRIGGRIMATEKRSVTLDKGVIKKVQKLARKEGRSFSNMVQRILQEYFKTGRVPKDG